MPRRSPAGTPALVVLQQSGVDFSVHAYQHDPAAESFGMEAADALGLDPATVFKTLLAILKMAEHICACYRTLGQQTEDHEWQHIETTILEYVGFSEYDFQILKETIRDLDIG